MQDVESAEARCRVVHHLNQFLRRLRQYHSEAEWTTAVLDAVSDFVSQAALFANDSHGLHLRRQFNLHIPESLSFPLSSAPAFATAIESKDPVIALRTAAEVTECLSGSDPGERALIVPILNGSRVVAVLFAANQDQIDVNALELVAGMASLVLERQSASPLKIVS